MTLYPDYCAAFNTGIVYCYLNFGSKKKLSHLNYGQQARWKRGENNLVSIIYTSYQLPISTWGGGGVPSIDNLEIV